MKHTLMILALAVSFAASVRALQIAKPAAAAGAAAVPRFEYCQYFNTYLEDELLNKFGNQGWELVSFNTIGEQQVNANFVGAKEYALTFKRQLGSGLKNCQDSRK
ncbi:MAG TPA: DUF4177 domain-containing protein [Candidatus Sulfotelmatobacter sp.]|nr:DUF4177 domain-containing protein [Candidatus Sulfotelmatobacter sp.]